MLDRVKKNGDFILILYTFFCTAPEQKQRIQGLGIS